MEGPVTGTVISTAVSKFTGTEVSKHTFSDESSLADSQTLHRCGYQRQRLKRSPICVPGTARRDDLC